MRRTAWLAPVVFLAQAGVVRWTAGGERPPAIPDLSSFQSQLGAWSLFREDPISTDVRAQLAADRVISRTYALRTDGPQASLLVAWFQTQSHGTRQPHSPQVCLPGAGWTPTLSDRIQIRTGGEFIHANRYLVAKGGATAVVLYWYQTSQRTVASEWLSKVWTVWEAVSRRRTDIALVRIVTWPSGEDYQTATGNGAAFSKELYPVLRRALPR